MGKHRVVAIQANHYALTKPSYLNVTHIADITQRRTQIGVTLRSLQGKLFGNPKPVPIKSQ